jgi:membrane fusion protein, multidrug efflux system
MRSALCVSVLVSLLAVSGFAQQQEATIIVGTVSAERTPIAKTLEFVGRVEAVNRVQINPRVKGFLEEVLFKEGELVKNGDPLYRIEQGTFEAAVQQAQGALERSKGAKALTEIQLQRAEQLLKSQSGNAVARDQAKAANEQANDAMLSDEASLVNRSQFGSAILKVAWRRASFDFLGFEQFRGDREGGEGFEADRP